MRSVRILSDEFHKLKNCFAWDCHRPFKLSQIVLLFGSKNAYGGPQNKAARQCLGISYAIQ